MRHRGAPACLALILAGCAAAPAAPHAPLSPSSPSERPSPPVAEGSASAEVAVREDGDRAVSPAPGLEGSLNLYAQGDYAKAAVALHEVTAARGVGAGAGLQAAEVQVAQFFLAKSLDHLGYRIPALAAFDEISKAPGHAYYLRALPWLARLADAMPDDEQPLNAIARYKLEDIGRGTAPQPAALLDHMRYYMGRASYKSGAFAEATARLRGVSPGSRYFLHARFFEGVCHVRMRDVDGAIQAFRAVADAPPRAFEVLAPGEADRLRDLAWLSLARVYYSAAPDEDAGDSLEDGDALLKHAIDAYGRVSPRGMFRDDALVELAWAHVRKGDVPRALASLDALSPAFVGRAPEAHVLRGLAYFTQCDMRRAGATIEAFRASFGPPTTEVERLGRLPPEDLFDVAEGVRSGASSLSARMETVVSSALAQRDVQRIFELLSMIKGEKERLAAAPPELRSSPLGVRIFKDLQGAERPASDRISATIRARCERFLRDTKDELARAARIEIDIEAVRGGSSTCSPRRSSAPSGSK